MEQFQKTWHYDEQGRRIYTMLRLRNRVMDGIRRCGLHPPQEETPPEGQGTVDMTSLRATLIPDKTWSLSPDLGEKWKYGCPRSPDCDSESSDEPDDGAEEKEESDHDLWNVRYGLEGLLSVAVRVFLVPDVVLCMRTTGRKWNGLYRPFAELYFFLMKKDVESCSLPPF